MLREHFPITYRSFCYTQKTPLLIGVVCNGIGFVENSIKALPKGEELESTGGSGAEWIVVVYDNDYNTVEEVIHILIAATHCSFEEAAIETWEIHHLGKSVVHHADKEECERVASIIATIGIRVEVKEG